MPEIVVTVYCITNTVNDKQYIGITRKSVDARFRQHLTDAKSPKSRLHRAMKKHGSDKFTPVEIASCFGWIEALRVEKLLIMERKSFLRGYNSTWGGDGLILPEVAKKISAAARAREEWYRNHPEEKKLRDEKALRCRRVPEVVEAASIQIRKTLSRLSSDPEWAARRAARQSASRQNLKTDPARYDAMRTKMRESKLRLLDTAEKRRAWAQRMNKVKGLDEHQPT